MQFIGQPSNAHRWVVEHGRGDAGVFDGFVAVEQGRDPPQIHGVRCDGVAAIDHGAKRGVVGDGIDDGAAFHLNARRQNLERRHDVFGRAQHIKDGGIWARQVFLEHECQLDLDAHIRELCVLDDRAVFKDLVFENRAIIRLGNAGGFLHDLRGQANFSANQALAVGDFSLNPLALHRVGILHGHIGVSGGQTRNHGAAVFRFMQLLSDVFVNDKEKQLACLLRAVHCRTQEVFLGKVRTKLAALYIERQLFANARYHIDAVVRCYASQGWRLPNEIDCWIHQPWITTTVPDAHDPVDYKTITDDILCNGAEECVAVVTYVDQKNHKATMIYGYHQRMTQKMRFKVTAGNTLKLHYIKDKEGKIRVLTAGKSQLSRDNDYAKYVDGTIDKREEKEFAFLKTDSCRYFVSPAVVKKNNLKNGDHVRSLIVCDYDKKKNSWNWVCVNVKK